MTSIALNGSNDAVLRTFHYQTFLQRLQNLTIYEYIYDLQPPFQNFMRVNTNWMAGRVWPAGHSVDTPAIGGRGFLD